MGIHQKYVKPLLCQLELLVANCGFIYDED